MTASKTDGNPASTPHPQAVFATTSWTVVLQAGDDSTRAQAAMANLCRSYWYPLYAYVRRRGYSPHDAQDLTQSFFTRFLGRNWVADADPERGRFRTFLLTALSRFIADEWDRSHAQKRGGKAIHVPLQMDNAETRYGYEPADNTSPEQCYERRWALTLLETVVERLRAEYERDGKGELFAVLHPCLIGDRKAQPYADLARKLGLSEGALKVAVHRLRQHYRRLLREEVAQTTATPEEVEDELRYLVRVLAGS